MLPEDTAMMWMVWTALALVAAGVAWLNWAEYQHRRALTPEERVREDEEIRRELQLW
jgi:hypothetical protein